MQLLKNVYKSKTRHQSKGTNFQRLKTDFQTIKTQQGLSTILFSFFFYKFIIHLFQILNLVLYFFCPSILLLQSFLASVFHFQSNSTMKFVIFQASSYIFSLSFKLSPFFQSIFRLDSKEMLRELGNPVFV